MVKMEKMFVQYSLLPFWESLEMEVTFQQDHQKQKGMNRMKVELWQEPVLLSQVPNKKKRLAMKESGVIVEVGSAKEVQFGMRLRLTMGEKVNRQLKRGVTIRVIKAMLLVGKIKAMLLVGYPVLQNVSVI